MENFNEFDSPAATPRRETGAIISHAFEIFKSTFLYCLLAVVIYFLLSYLIQIITGFNTTVLVEEIKEKTSAGETLDYNELIKTPGLMTYSAISFLFGLFLTPIFVSLIYLANKSNFKQKLSVSDIFFCYRQNLLNIVLYALISQTILSVGFLLCFLPGFFLMPLFFIGYPVLIFENATAFEALNKTFSIAKENYGTFLLTALLAAVISVAGVVLCCVGIYLTIPFAFIAMYSTYCAFCGAPKQIEYKP